MIFSVIVGKLVAGVTAVAVALLLFGRSFPAADASASIHTHEPATES